MFNNDFSPKLEKGILFKWPDNDWETRELR